uniref:DNA mismatch repair protein MSH3 n=2 Tax=Scheffersomyces stipitis (strain ATCC 58785 / CBS 6054 / NBRC 10063 / NRRL Y-11545) TaxID=322104 RepID=MSH3_PICST|nr:RecName: Full=DNA mismatch repair protein MSH3; AltName: Full=MutS protein homolog 3 [Scheffersomyces stipitis CBS 6054]
MSYRSKQASISRFFKSTKSNNSAKNEPAVQHIPKKTGVMLKFSYNNKENVVEGGKDTEGPHIVGSHVELPGQSVNSVVNSDSIVVNSNLEIDPKISSVLKRKPDIDIQLKTTKKRSKTLTPLEKQIRELRESHKDKVLVIQIGYKYKMFGDDAKLGSKILDIMYIRGGDDGTRDEFSYCSFPDFKLHINLKRLLTHGLKIGVVKQLESAIVKTVEKSSKSSDLMKREITGVYTRGTYMGDEYVQSSGNSADTESPYYIICINEINQKELSMVAVQPKTGDIVQDTFKDGLNRDELETRLMYLNPSEVIVLSSEQPSVETLKTIRLVASDVQLLPRKRKGEDEVFNGLIEFFDSIDNGKYKHLGDYFSVNFSKHIQSCFYELINYLSEFKLSNVFTIPDNISNFTNSRKYMVLPNNTLYALEIFQNYTNPASQKGTLIWLLNHTRTRFGNRLLNKWVSKPLIEKEKIEERLLAIEDLTGDFNNVVDALKIQLDKMGKSLDLEELLMKTHYAATYNLDKINRRDIYNMLDCFQSVLESMNRFEKGITEFSKTKKSPLLTNILLELSEMSKTTVVSNLLNKINRSYVMNESKDPEEQVTQFFNLDNHNWEDIRSEFSELDKIEKLFEEELLNIRRVLKRPQLQYITNNKEPYLIEVRNGKQVDELPTDFHRINGTTTVSRFRSERTAQLYIKKQYHKEKLLVNCNVAFNDFLKEIDEQYEFFSKIVKNLSVFDCLLSLTAASLASKNTRPILVDQQLIEVQKGRNPIIESLHNRNDYVPNDIDICYDNKVLIITGPNMGGKSSYVKQVALLVIMSQIGCYIPCDRATLGVFDSIFIRMGASDNILKGNSTFMNEMLECSNIIHGISNKSLVILDEIGRGTGTSDGIALAYSILRYLIESPLRPLVLFITHYPSLHVLEDSFPTVVTNYHMGFQQIHKDDNDFPEIIFLYNLVKGVINNSYGLNVAKLAGLPVSVISGAHRVSESLKYKVEIQQKEQFTMKFGSILQMLKKDEINSNNILELENLFSYI